MEKKVSKEVKIGMAVIGVLATSFSYALVKRLAHESQAAAATTTADPDHASDAAKAAAHAKEAGEKPTLLAGLESGRPSELTPEQKGSTGGSPNPRRHELADAADPGTNSGDSYMPAAHQPPRELPDAHADGDHPRDHHAAPAAYGQPEYGNGNTAPGSAGQPAGNQGGFGGPALGPGAIAGAGDPQPLHADSPAANPAADPFQHHSATPPTSADNPPLRSAGPPMTPPDVPDAPRAPRAFGPDDHGAGGRGPDAQADLGAGDPHHRDSPHLNGIVADPSATGSIQVPGNGFSAGGKSSSSDRAPVISGDAGIAAETRHSELAAAAPTYASPPASLQATTDPLAAPQQLVGDSTARKGQYLVQPNDNFWSISEKVYGTGGYFKAIFEYNRSRHPQADRLQVGEAIEVPDASVLQKTYPDLCPKPGHGTAASRVVPASARMQPGTRVYTVEEGDTLFEVARRELGKPSRWGEIYSLNREALGTDFDYLRPGTQLLIPADAGRGDPIAREPSATITR
jgi:nucleoid-associated protein YgaU